MPPKTENQTARMQLRMPKALRKRLDRAARASATGETAADIARAGLVRELDVRERREKKQNPRKKVRLAR